MRGSGRAVLLAYSRLALSSQLMHAAVKSSTELSMLLTKAQN